MPDTNNDNKSQKTTTTESKVTGDSTKPTTLDDRIAQMDSKPKSAPAFSSIPSTDSHKTESKPKPELIPEQKSFEKLADKPKPEPKPEPEPEPAVATKSEPARVMDEGEPQEKNKVLRMFVVGLIVGAILTSIFI